MIKALFTALTGIDESIDSQESQTSWESRRYADENDLDDDDDQSKNPWWVGLGCMLPSQESINDDDEPKKGWFSLW